MGESAVEWLGGVMVEEGNDGERLEGFSGFSGF